MVSQRQGAAHTKPQQQKCEPPIINRLDLILQNLPRSLAWALQRCDESWISSRVELYNVLQWLVRLMTWKIGFGTAGSYWWVCCRCVQVMVGLSARLPPPQILAQVCSFPTLTYLLISDWPPCSRDVFPFSVSIPSDASQWLVKGMGCTHTQFVESWWRDELQWSYLAWALL